MNNYITWLRFSFIRSMKRKKNGFYILTLLSVLPLCSMACIQTQPVQPPGGTTPAPTTTTTDAIPGSTTTTTLAPGVTTTTVSTTTVLGETGCCPIQTQFFPGSGSEFPDGVMTVTYNNDDCRGTMEVTCAQTDPAFDLYAAIVANGMDFLDFGPNSVTFPGTCGLDNQWYMGFPPLLIQTLECRLTNPPS